MLLPQSDSILTLEKLFQKEEELWGGEGVDWLEIFFDKKNNEGDIFTFWW